MNFSSVVYNGEKRLLQQAYDFQEAANSNRKAAETIVEPNWEIFDYKRGYSPELESSGIGDILEFQNLHTIFTQVSLMILLLWTKN